MLVDGQGNFGSVDGDSPAAMRYTEVRLMKIAHTLLDDLDKETVDFALNYDETESEPVVLPARIPNLLINGSSGIAVGMATNIPPHNLNEVIDACLAMILEPQISIDELMTYIPGPDFPTAGIINGHEGIKQAYKTGKGLVHIRARTNIETDKSGKEAIIITELPYQVNKARLQEKIGDLVKEKRLEGISAIRDESDKQGMRVVIELKRGEIADVILNNLFIHTQMQSVFGINLVALDKNQPKLLNLWEMLDAFLKHRREVVVRRTIFRLKKTRQRVHLLEGLAIALANIDEVVALIKAAKNVNEAKEKLLDKLWTPGSTIEVLLKRVNEAGTEENTESGMTDGGYKLSEKQAQAILDMRLHRLTGLEQDKIINEYKELLDLIIDLLDILSNPDRLMQVIKEELLSVKELFGDKRRTEIIEEKSDLTKEDLIPEEDMVITLSRLGYTKIQPLKDYSAQHRGGKGKSSSKMKEEDFIEQFILASTHDFVLCFSNFGKVYWIKVYELPQGGRGARGKPLVNLLPLSKEEYITAILPVRDFSENKNVFMVTEKGTVKKVALNNFSRPRSSGIKAIDLADKDNLVGVDITDGNQKIMLFSDVGKVICFDESQVRTMGRSAKGVRGISLKKDQKVVSLIVAKPDTTILTATENGYGKRTYIKNYSQINRGGQGVISIRVNSRNGKVIGAIKVKNDNEVMLIGDKGTLVRMRVKEISVIGRNTQGVRLVNLSDSEKLTSLKCIEDLEE